MCRDSHHMVYAPSSCSGKPSIKRQMGGGETGGDKDKDRERRLEERETLSDRPPRKSNILIGGQKQSLCHVLPRDRAQSTKERRCNLGVSSLSRLSMSINTHLNRSFDTS